ncbi:MAG TPA: hypothetical protein VEH29_18240 [Acidimicrobiales bacterium]|nr:hypothetical protein [Acidimicrobiales bacterium]
MTKYTKGPRCGWCGRDLALGGSGRGRPRQYCRQSCRQRAYELRRRQQAGTLQRHEVPISQADFERCRDGIYAITAALEDVEVDLAEDGDFQAAFRHLYAAATELRGFELTVST